MRHHVPFILALAACQSASSYRGAPAIAATDATDGQCRNTPLAPIARADDAFRRYGAARALAQSSADRDLKAAIEQFTRLAGEHPWFSPAMRALGITHGMRGNWVASYTAYTRYLDYPLDSADREAIAGELRLLEGKQVALGKFAVAASWMRVKEWHRAAGELREVIEAKPQFALAYLYLGRVYEALGQEKEAVAAFTQYLDRDPTAPDRSKIELRTRGRR